MSTAFSFQTQLVSIMDALSKTAVMEIGRLVEIESKMLKIEITRGRNEIASLGEKLQLMEKLLYIAQGGRQLEACSYEREEDGSSFEPDRARSVTQRENQWETISSSTVTNRSDHHAATEVPPKEQAVLVLKEEPQDVEIEPTELGRQIENGPLKSSDVTQDLDTAPEYPSSIFNNQFASPSTQFSHQEPGRSETCWTSELRATDTRKNDNPTPQGSLVHRNVRLHSLRNSNIKRVGCQQCGKHFKCFSQLEIHQRSHTGEKPFRCTLCGKRYSQKGHLYTHQRTHTGEKPYRCPICGKGFIQKCTLDMHQRTHTGEKPFMCIKCGKGFTKNCNLKKHLKVHLDLDLNGLSGDLCASTYNQTFINENS